MGEISRRDFLNGVVGTVASTLLSRLPTASASDFDSIDDITEKMLKELGTSTKDDVKDYKYRYCDNASVVVNACIKGYKIEYWAYDHGIERLMVKSEKKQWDFWGEGSLEKGVTFFSSDHGLCKTEGAILKYAMPMCNRVRDLLDINVHLQDCKGRDLTHVVDSLSKNVLSAKEFETKYQGDLFLASYKKEDFTIKYEFYKRNKKIDFIIRDGENWLRFFVGYGMLGNVDRIYLYINDSYFWVDSGKLTKFPRKVYNEYSAMNIVNKAKEIEAYLTSNIRNIKDA